MSKTMGKKSDIPALLDLAFKAAKLGDEKQARKRWRQAIEKGYVVHPRTQTGFDLAIDGLLKMTFSADPRPYILRTINHRDVLEFREEPHARAVYQGHFTEVDDHDAIGPPRPLNLPAQLA